MQSKTARAADPFVVSYGNIFEDVCQFLGEDPNTLFNRCMSGPKLAAQDYLRAKAARRRGRRASGEREIYRSHMRSYFYDLLYFNGAVLGPNAEYRRSIERALEVAGKGPVADFGSGLGTLALCFALAGRDATSIEINEELTRFQTWRVGKRLGEPTAGTIRHATAFPRGKKFALLSCLEVVEHLDDPVAWLIDAHRRLRPGGHLWVSHSFTKGDGQWPMHRDDTATTFRFLDTLQAHFEFRERLAVGALYRRRARPRRAGSARAAKAPRPERIILHPEASLRISVDYATRRVHHLLASGRYFQRPVRVTKPVFDLLHRNALLYCDGESALPTKRRRLEEELALLLEERLILT